MAREQERKHISVRPSEMAAGGGNIGFPQGSKVTIKEIAWATWEEAGESALKGGREAADPALKIVGEVDGVDEPKTEFLGAGKANRFQPTRDGEFLEPADGSTATSLNDSCNAAIFLISLSDKKRHGKNAVPEDLADDGISALTGLTFIAGKEIVKREGLDMGDRKPRPTLVADEIVELPGQTGRRVNSSRQVEDEPAPGRSSAKGANGKKGSADVDVDEEAEKAMLELLSLPKFRKGLPLDKVFIQVYNLTKDHEETKAISALVSDEGWLGAKARPWKLDDGVIVAS